MSLHINRFIDRIKAAESRQQKDIIMTMSEAKDLHADITKILLGLQVLLEQNQTKASQEDSVITVEIEGGRF